MIRQAASTTASMIFQKPSGNRVLARAAVHPVRRRFSLASSAQAARAFPHWSEARTRCATLAADIRKGIGQRTRRSTADGQAVACGTAVS